MNNLIILKIILESYDNFFLRLIEYEEEIKRKDLSKDEKELSNDIKNNKDFRIDFGINLKLNDFDKETLFSNISIIYIFLKLFDQYEVNLKKKMIHLNANGLN